MKYEETDDEIVVRLKGKPYAKQQLFFDANTTYIAYGGARGGGKSWALRRKAILLALKYERIKILIIRSTYPELEKNHIFPLLEELNNTGLGKYNAKDKVYQFINGSLIQFGYCSNDKDILQYQGLAYEVVMIDEATHQDETRMQAFMEINRLSGRMRKPFSPRMYFTANPGGVGHNWFKRLFIDKQYTDDEDPNDYTFISAKVYDNEYIMTHDPKYVKKLENLPEVRRKQMLDGDWDIFAGIFFPDWQRDKHVVEPYKLKKSWPRFISLDYGLDTCAVYWYAVKPGGRLVVTKEIHEPDLILSAAGKRIFENNKNKPYDYIVASPDLWNRRQETGESGIDILKSCGLKNFVKANNSRIPGWRKFREMLALKEAYDGMGGIEPYITFFSTCVHACANIPKLQHDPHRPEDCMDKPHDITHAPESLRYGIMSRFKKIEVTEATNKKIKGFNKAFEDSQSLANDITTMLYGG